MKCDVTKCHAACCGIVPIPKETVEKHLMDVQGPFERVPFIDGMEIVLKTGKPVCAFLTSEYRCAIYEDRPEICRIFGDVGTKGNPLLKCHFRCKITDADRDAIRRTANQVFCGGVK